MLDRIDLIKLVGEVIDGVDLPEIIRESTGSMASDTVRGVRMQGIVAVEAVGHAVTGSFIAAAAVRRLSPPQRPHPGQREQAALPGQRDPRR